MEKNRDRMRRLAAALGAALLLTALAACSQQQEAQEPAQQQTSSQTVKKDVFPEGTSIGGKNIGGKKAKDALETARKALDEAVKSLEISVKFKDDTVALRRDDFEVQDMLELTIPKLLESGKADKYEIPYVVDLSEKGKQKLLDAAKSCLTAPKQSTVTGYDREKKGFVFTDEQLGSRVDMAATLTSVRQLLSQKHGGAIQAAFVETKPKLTKKYLTDNFKQMSSYVTVSTNTEAGNNNMRLALSHVDGTILQPGAEFSYNSTIGDSTDPSGGWQPAGGILGGILVQMYGGGICQGSTTLYNAALLAGMEIVERDCHSMPSSYCPIGLDATVDYGNIDFRFKNPLETPVYISAWMDGVELHVVFYGCFPEEWDKIDVVSEEVGTEAPLSTVSYTVDQSLQKGQYVRKSSGNTGYYARAYRTYYKGGKTVKNEELPSSHYAPTGTVYAVGEGTDTSKIDVTKESGTVEPSPSPSPSVSPTPSESPTPPPEEPSPPPPPGPEDFPTPTPSLEPPPIFEETPPPEELPTYNPGGPTQNPDGVIEW